MTPTRYHLARFMGRLGLSRKAKRLGDAADETNLLQEAEIQLGGRIWKKTEAIEALSDDYWSLRKLSFEQEQLLARIGEQQEQLTQAEEQRKALLDEQGAGESRSLNQQRDALLRELSAKTADRERISADGLATRRQHHAEKTKLEVLGRDARANPEELARIRKSIEELAAHFEQLKEQRDRLNREISRLEAQIGELDGRLRTVSAANHAQSNASTEAMNHTRKLVWQLHAEKGLLESRMHPHHLNIGRHVSRNHASDPACREAAQGQRGLIEVMAALRRSIALNHRLAGHR